MGLLCETKTVWECSCVSRLGVERSYLPLLRSHPGHSSLRCSTARLAVDLLAVCSGQPASQRITSYRPCHPYHPCHPCRLEHRQPQPTRRAFRASRQ